MRQNLLNFAAFAVLAAGLFAGGWYIDKNFMPKPEPKPVEPIVLPRETVQALAGAVVGSTEPANKWRITSKFETAQAALPKEAPKPVEPAKVTVAEPIELIALGDDSSLKKVILTTRGGAIQQVTLRKIDEANRIGREVKGPDGRPQPLRVIPGLVRPRDTNTLKEENDGYIPELAPGKVTNPAILSEPSYVLLHYPAEDDPQRQPKEAERLNDQYPSAELGERNWKVTEQGKTPEGDYRVSFETSLGSPYFLKLKKTYTLAARDYHVGFTLDIIPEAGREKGKGKFRYQIVGAHGIPVEGEWYAQSYRNVMVGSITPKGSFRRSFEDAATIHTQSGGMIVNKGENTFTYAAVGSQYFASALAIDETQPPALKSGMWDYVRPTREPAPWDDPTHLFLSDVTFRVVSMPIDLEPGQTLSHKYLIYNGPMKVRLLGQMIDKETKDVEVSTELVERYLNKLTLNTLTDYHSPNFFGKVANAIYWSDVVITSTNLMHDILGFLHRYVPIWGLNIIMLTVMVRMVLFVPSRKQQATMARMQEKMAKMKPELDILTAKYKDDPAALQQEKTKLMFKHGVNPLATMGGCLLLFAQMPVFMGLYFCLQESVFFRLEPFLWFQNLAAPDMTVWWSETIPFISVPESLGGAIYLGPFFNILPLIAVSLIFIQQWISMPPPTDEQQEMQQKMMKFMVLIMAIFFYKSPSGLCLYFICSTSWALAERKLIKKSKPTLGDVPPPDSLLANGKPDAPTEPENPGLIGRMRDKMRTKMEELQQQADAQADRQIRNDPNGGKPKKKRRK